MFLYFDALTWSPASNLGSYWLFSLSKSIYMLDFTSTGFTLILLWYLLLYLLTISSNLSMYTFFDFDVNFVL